MSTWGDVFRDLIPAFVGLGGKLVADNQLKQQAKGQANDAKAIADLQYKTALANQQAIELQNRGGTTAEKPKSNTALYIGLGVGGVVLIGVVIFAVTRK